MTSRYIVSLATLPWLVTIVVTAAQGGGARTVWDGVYTDAQAERGAKLYAAQCSSCHGEDMKAGPGAPSLAGPEFTFGWDKKPLGGLFEFVRANMPPGQAGSLRDQEYADIIAAIVKRNGAPASATASLPSTKAELDSVTFLADKP
jgi:S-disulfanyl-L-cysteine oxidoreductase SoxD